ncbi:SapB/AmfS family lanthipeptide [Actinomadura geliboluensis]|uniref:SapB/AmfS family lantipeptide n=1 Tax=Actinomadura geliboluensis TaxID=882440 RepID=A0A5S4H6R0_9ACTN|nr:SapB/AmfS family lanthipeptide [Actinomadura geliboluensis]TMR40923.1 SapB/AmfS family lantipeptide [Actinomadura geliboluensis]
MALLDLQGMVSENGGGGNSSLSLLCHSSHSVTICL